MERAYPLKATNKKENKEISPSSSLLQILEAHTKVAEKKEMYRPYNILPLDPDSQNQAIMRYPEVGFPIKFIVPANLIPLSLVC